MTAILKEEPPDLPLAERHIPPALARIVERSVEKAPAARFQSTQDLAFALEALSTYSGSDVQVVSRAAAREPQPAVLGAERRTGPRRPRVAGIRGREPRCGPFRGLRRYASSYRRPRAGPAAANDGETWEPEHSRYRPTACTSPSSARRIGIADLGPIARHPRSTRTHWHRGRFAPSGHRTTGPWGSSAVESSRGSIWPVARRSPCATRSLV